MVATKACDPRYGSLSVEPTSYISRNGPDPSALTIARIDHEISSLKELQAVKEGVVEARLGAMDKAVALLEKFPTAIDIAVENLEKLHNEKFAGVEIRFHELDTRLSEGDKYKQTALDAALKAAQTLVDKVQDNNEKSIKKTEESLVKQIEGMKETIDGLKETVRYREGSTHGVQNGWLILVGAIICLSTVVSVVVSLLHHVTG